MKQNVVVTSMSCITPLGRGIETTWDALLNQVSGVKKITKFDASSFSSPYAAEVNEHLLGSLPSQGRSMMTYQNQLLLWSVIDAWNKGGYSELESNKLESIPLYFGNGSVNFDFNTLKSLIEVSRDGSGKINFKEFMNKVDKTPPLDIVKTMATTSNYFAAKALNTHGLGNPIYNGEASSLSAVIEACKSIEAGENEVVVIGSADANIIPHVYHYMNKLNISYKNGESEFPNKISRPFDENAQGIVYGEGSACLVLESEEHAVKRNAKIIGVLKGGNVSLWPSDNPFILKKDGFEKSIKNSLLTAGLEPDLIDVIFPFSPSHKLWDVSELQAIDSVFSGCDYVITSAKGHMGLLGSTAGLLDLILSLQAINKGKIFHTMNFEKVDLTVSDEIQNRICHQNNDENSINRALTCSASIGGFYSTMIAEKWS